MIFSGDLGCTDTPILPDPDPSESCDLLILESTYGDREAKALKSAGDHPLDFKNLYSVEKYRDHKQLMEMKGPIIIIARSGMCTGRRIVDHLTLGLDDPKNDLYPVSDSNILKRHFLTPKSTL